MLKRYSRQKLSAIWSEDNKFRISARVECAVLEALSGFGIVPSYVHEIASRFGSSDSDNIAEIEETTKHDVIAFLTDFVQNIRINASKSSESQITETQIKDVERFLHYGMTSSDLLDTTLAIQLGDSMDLILKELQKTIQLLKGRAIEFKNLECIGRSHGIHAEPTSFGLKLLNFYCEFDRVRKRLEYAREGIRVCMISGPVGNFSSLTPQIEKRVADSLGLRPVICSTQVISRDIFADVFLAIAQLAASIEHISIEIRHLQRTEVGEVEEGFSKGQKGSSAMPHKKNPISTENLTGLARLMRSFAAPALENVSLWHERDISHSSVERIIAPDATILADFALARLNQVIENLVVKEDAIRQNLLRSKDLYRSHAALLALLDMGVDRVSAYKIVQDSARGVWSDSNVNFVESLKQNSEFIEHCLSAGVDSADIIDKIAHHNYLHAVDEIFSLVIG